MHACMHTHTHMCTHTRAHTHTHTHTKIVPTTWFKFNYLIIKIIVFAIEYPILMPFKITYELYKKRSAHKSSITCIFVTGFPKRSYTPFQFCRDVTQPVVKLEL